MSFLSPTGTQWRTPQFGKSVIVSTYRGVTRIQAWPKKRGQSKNQVQINRQRLFALVQKAVKHLSHWEVNYVREAINEHNRTHRGQRGSAAIRLRDWQTQRLYGRGFAITMPGFGTIYPPACKVDCTEILDHASDVPNSTLMRGLEEWESKNTGQANQVLIAGAAGALPEWKTRH